MPRVKSGEQIESLQRKQKELTDRLKAAKAKQRAEAKEIEDRKAAAAGRLVVSELIENATGPLAVAFRAVANIKMTKAGERELFELPDLSPPKANGKPHIKLGDTIGGTGVSGG